MRPSKRPTEAICAALLAPALAATWPAAAEVVDAAANGFTVKHRVVIAAGRDAVYRTAVDNIDAWWHPDHTMTGVAENLYIKAFPGGCFCETFGPDAGLVHLSLTFVNPGVMLRFTGGLGPLGLMGVNGNMTWEFADAGGGTEVVWHYAVGGYSADGLDTIAPAVDAVLGTQLERLKAQAERAGQVPQAN